MGQKLKDFWLTGDQDQSDGIDRWSSLTCGEADTIALTFTLSMLCYVLKIFSSHLKQSNYGIRNTRNILDYSRLRAPS